MDEVIEEIQNETEEVIDNSATSASEENVNDTSVATENESNNADVNSEVESNSNNGNAKKTYSDMEKATYSFHKQLNKQKSKYEKAMAEKEAQFNQLLERLDRLENPDKYRAKTRNDFNSDDEYIDHIVAERVNNILNSQMAAYQKEQDEINARNEAEQEFRTRQDDNVSKFYPDEASRTEYQNAIDSALAKGLGDLIDSDKELANYIIMSPMGPKLMYKLATDVNTVKSLFENSTPMDRQFKIREIERTLTTEINNKVMPKVSKPIGRPGIERTSPSKDLFESDDSILKYLRGR